jgi:hypothetical protein
MKMFIAVLPFVNMSDDASNEYFSDGISEELLNQVRITVQLIDALSDTHLWSETYDRTLNDIFVIQDEIAAEVIKQLKITLLDDTLKTSETNTEAYALFLRGRHLTHQRTPEAMAIDPDNALAHAFLSRIAEVYDGDLMVAARELELALTLEPANPDILNLAGEFLRNLSQLDDAIVVGQYSVNRDPVNPKSLTGRHRPHNSSHSV